MSEEKKKNTNSNKRKSSHSKILELLRDQMSKEEELEEKRLKILWDIHREKLERIDHLLDIMSNK